MDIDEIIKIKKKYSKSLGGHVPVQPREYFTELADFVAAEERADFYGAGDSLRNFEKEIAELFGHEDCVFLPSGTMAQVTAMRIWADAAQNSLIGFHPSCHLEIHEEDSYRALHNLQSVLIGEKHRLISLADLKNMREAPAAVLLELPQREIGGLLPSWQDLTSQIEYLRSQNIKVHVDGARLWECAPFYQKTYAEIGALFDSVYLSFYKGIGAVAGAALLGPKDFVEQARVWQRRHGGNLITLFPLYLSAKLNFRKRIDQFPAYFKRTQEIVDLIREYSELEARPCPPQVNMFHLFFNGSFDHLMKRTIAVSEEVGFWTFNFSPTDSENIYKFEWYVGDATLSVPLEQIRYVLQQTVC